MQFDTTQVSRTFVKAYSDLLDRAEIDGDASEEMIIERDADVYMFPKTWPSTACGHGGIGGQAFTETETVVFDICSHGLGVFVYQGSRFSYEISNPNQQFRQDLSEFSLTGEHEYEGEYEEE